MSFQEMMMIVKFNIFNKSRIFQLSTNTNNS